MAITMNDVAKKVAVSKATVSRVFRNPECISAETVARVLKAAKELNYQPPCRKTGRNNRSAILVGFEYSFRHHVKQNPTILDIIHGVELEAKQNNMLVSIHSLGYDAMDSAEMEIDLPFELETRLVRGMVILGHASDKLFKFLDDSGIPFVAVEALRGYSNANIVMPDHYEAGYKSTKYLLDLGHRQIAYAGAPSEYFSINLQILGYRQAMSEYGLAEQDLLIIPTDMKSYFELQTGKKVVENILSMKKKPTSLIFGGEVDAAEALRELQRNGLDVPGDINIIALGSTTMSLCSSTNPTLTNVCCIKDELLGRLAVERLREIITDKSQPCRKIVLPTRLVKGGSTSSPRQ